MKHLKYFINKFADVWALMLIAIGLFFFEPIIRQYYDNTTAEMGGSFYTTILYRWMLVVVSSLSAYLALRFNYWNSIGAYYFKHDSDGKSDFHKDWNAAKETPSRLWRIALFLSLWLFLTYLMLHAPVGAPLPPR